MKKIKFETEKSEIHTSEIKTESPILIKRKGEIFGVAIFDCNLQKWMCRTSDKKYYDGENLDLLKQNIDLYCEFYVLD